MRIHFVKVSEKGMLEDYLELDDGVISLATDRVVYVTERCRAALVDFFQAEDKGPDYADIG